MGIYEALKPPITFSFMLIWLASIFVGAWRDGGASIQSTTSLTLVASVSTLGAFGLLGCVISVWIRDKAMRAPAAYPQALASITAGCIICLRVILLGRAS